MSPETGSLLLLLLFCAGATAVNLTTAHPSADKEASGTPILREKPGKCPANVDFPVDGSTLKKECKRDRDCKLELKCCFSGGTQRCLLPLDAKENSCPYFNKSQCVRIKPAPQECHRDDQCQGTERCCFYQCRLQCTPTVKAVKSGTCPVPSTLCAISPSSPPPKPLCTSDNDCPGEKKCCTPKCRQECTDPLPSVKSGTCPVPVTACVISPTSLPPKPLCTSDDDCPGEKKCCTPKCRQECTDPLPLKSGTCPISIARCAFPPPKPKCKNDSDCQGKQKCCTPVCGLECTNPVPVVKSGTCPAPVTPCVISPFSPPPKPLCMSDDDCLGKKKCCKQKCRQECTDPLPCKLQLTINLQLTPSAWEVYLPIFYIYLYLMRLSHSQSGRFRERCDPALPLLIWNLSLTQTLSLSDRIPFPTLPTP
ncbi:keratin-associated protein 10-7-like isoform X3 [Rana temporaria]|uniref:keratin-associated protein 10-7-like isoform X3 n=1 Tax=Rana temporaria TaxID=8407 RepID=UPI001AAC7C90|nr:keratin-associated protein 10-7-like isoform X3 [Rana temporaria]